MAFLPTRSHSRRAPIGCSRCGQRITLADRIRKDGDGFAHEVCVDVPTAGRSIPTQRRA